MKINSQQLIKDLEVQTRAFIKKVEELQNLDAKSLNWKKNSDSWSVLECLEHLNLYGDFYIPEIKKRISNSTSPKVEFFKSGLLGDYFASSMLPKEKLNRMKTFKDKNPVNSSLNSEVLVRFISQQYQLLELLKSAQNVNLNQVKTKITIPFIRLKLGDTFRFLVNHTIRHFAQIERVLMDSKG